MSVDFLTTEQKAQYGQYACEPNEVQLSRFFHLFKPHKKLFPCSIVHNYENNNCYVMNLLVVNYDDHNYEVHNLRTTWTKLVECGILMKIIIAIFTVHNYELHS